MRNLNLENVDEAGDFTRVPVGGYICKITKVEDVSNKEYLKLEYEIVDGQHKGSSERMHAACGFWPNFIRSYKEKALPFFKSFVTALETSNQGYKWDNDERKIVGKFVGLVLGEEEYMTKNGETKTRLYVAQVRSGQKIRSGDFEVPPLKVLKNSGNNYDDPGYEQAPTSAYDSEVPF